jgi:hypothetical protein
MVLGPTAQAGRLENMGFPAGGGPIDHSFPQQARQDALSPLPEQGVGGWPSNELEQVLAAAMHDPGATARVVEVLGRSHVVVPLPNGGTPGGESLDLPSMELAGAAYVPVFSSPEQLRMAAHQPMPFAVAPMWEFARGLPVGVGIAVNPGGVVGIPIPAEGVAELFRGPREGAGDVHESPDAAAHPVGGGARVALRRPVPGEDPVDFLTAAAAELALTPVVLSARRALASVEGEPERLYIGVELDSWQPEDKEAATQALGRALGAVPLPWAVNIVLLDVAQDPVGDWMLSTLEPFFERGA